METEINNERITNALKLYHSLPSRFIEKKEITGKPQISVYKTIYRPIRVYSKELDVANKKEN